MASVSAGDPFLALVVFNQAAFHPDSIINPQLNFKFLLRSHQINKTGAHKVSIQKNMGASFQKGVRLCINYFSFQIGTIVELGNRKIIK
jgi:hypothetical protein